jgi:hypothetical protein
MTRVYRERAALDRTKAVHRKKPYKVVMESVTQEKKKLRSVVSNPGEYPVRKP